MKLTRRKIVGAGIAAALLVILTLNSGSVASYLSSIPAYPSATGAITSASIDTQSNVERIDLQVTSQSAGFIPSYERGGSSPQIAHAILYLGCTKYQAGQSMTLYTETSGYFPTTSMGISAPLPGCYSIIRATLLSSNGTILMTFVPQ